MSLITYLTRIHFADRVLEDAVGVELARLGVHRPLVVADEAGGGEAVDRLCDALPPRVRPVVLPLAAGGTPHSVVAALAEGACDGVIGIGGWHALDLARDGARRPGDGRALPVLAVPTTVARIGIEPRGMRTPGHETADALPAAVLCDPTLTLALDARRTAETGMEALVQAVEAYLAAAYNPPADGMALEGARRAAAHLARAVADGRDLEARRELMAAGLNAGLAAQKGRGGGEALARAVAAEQGMPDRTGRFLAALMPPLLAFNAPAAGERYGALAEAIRPGKGGTLAEALAALGDSLGLPRHLGPPVPDPALLARAARRAASDPASRTNPRHVTEADYRRFLEAALEARDP